jgi:hypothetical protein
MICASKTAAALKSKPERRGARDLIDRAAVLRRAAQDQLPEVHRVKFTPAQKRRKPK